MKRCLQTNVNQQPQVFVVQINEYMIPFQCLGVKQWIYKHTDSCI